MSAPAIPHPGEALFIMLQRVARGRKNRRTMFRRRTAKRRTNARAVHIARIGAEEIYSNLLFVRRNHVR